MKISYYAKVKNQIAKLLRGSMIKRFNLKKVILKTIPTTKEPPALPNLIGDRELEWTYVAARIGRYADEHSLVLDFGCGIGMLSLASASIGARVLAIDLLPQQFRTGYPNIEFRQVDLMSLEQSGQFDLILNCSTIEHVGLSGRYNAIDSPDGDLQAMGKLQQMLKPGGTMLLTLPVGQDAIIHPLHRIYGEKRLQRLLDGHKVIESSFWRKDENNIWLPCSQVKAMAEVGRDNYYALGCMVLQPEK
jgi:2-polyprenyl-3-methyl-5-hydroxy-6-metoxy-1,4-benzoquinol methylase